MIKGMSLLLSSHLLPDVQAGCSFVIALTDRLAIYRLAECLLEDCSSMIKPHSSRT